METTEIQNFVRGLTSVDSLATLLNKIKKDEFHMDNHPITRKMLFHFCDGKIAKNRYRTFHIKKKSGGTRTISSPCYQLGIILYNLNIMFKAIYSPSQSAMGFTAGRSIVDNALMHVGQHYVLNLDLKDFFPSISQGRVWKRIQYAPFNFNPTVASVIAGLCCTQNEEKTGNVLPQGAATSPLLTNAICDELDRKLRAIARRHGLHYSRYADDMTFSSMYNIFQPDGDFMKEIREVIKEQGFTLNENKTRLLRNGERQEVTGLTVNDKVNIPRKYVRDLRCILHVWEKEGYAKAYSYFYPHYKREKGYIKKGEPVMENVLEGKLDYLKMIRGGNNACYLKLRSRYDALQQMVYADNESEKESFVYVQPYSEKEFEKDFNTHVRLEISSKGKLVGKCEIAGMAKTLAVSKTTQSQLCPDLEKRTAGETILSDNLKRCFITLCRQKGKNFWLISKFRPKRSACLSIQNAKLDIDALLDVWEKQGIKEAAIALSKLLKFGDEIEVPESDNSPKELEKSNNSLIMKLLKAHSANLQDMDLDTLLDLLD